MKSHLLNLEQMNIMRHFMSNDALGRMDISRSETISRQKSLEIIEHLMSRNFLEPIEIKRVKKYKITKLGYHVYNATVIMNDVMREIQ